METQRLEVRVEGLRLRSVEKDKKKENSFYFYWGVILFFYRARRRIDPGGRAAAELNPELWTAEETRGILLRAEAVAAAFTSTSLRDRLKETGDWPEEERDALAEGQKQEIRPGLDMD